MNDKSTITRKYVIIPVENDDKDWDKRVVKFFENKVEDTKIKSKEKNKYKEYLEKLEKGILEKEMINDYTYPLIRECMSSEALRKNYILSNVSAAYINCISNGMDIKEAMSVVNEKLKCGYRVKGSKEGSLFDNTSIDNYLGGYGKAFNQELTSKFKDCVKKGYQYGNVSLPNYKKDSPFHIEKAHMSFTHDYDSFEELCENINKSGCKLYFNYGSNGKPTIAKFKIDLGHGKNRDELLTTLLRIYSGEYEFCGSSIQLSKKNKIILNLSMKIPKKKVELDENTVMGIDLGMAIPAACGINNNKYARLYVGSKDNFLNQRKKIREQRKRLQRNLSMTSGGHGRNKKLKPLNRLSEHEKHWVQNYNHKLSRDVVEFAKKNGAKYINMEYLKGYNTSKFILSNWSFYQVQQYIKYKSEQYGVEVRFVNPCYTSQVCSHCHKKGDRKSQSTFVCTNPECKEHGKEVNADFNASRNIAQSELFITDKKDVKIEDLIKQAKKYYNIDDSEDEEYAFD